MGLETRAKEEMIRLCLCYEKREIHPNKNVHV